MTTTLQAERTRVVRRWLIWVAPWLRVELPCWQSIASRPGRGKRRIAGPRPARQTGGRDRSEDLNPFRAQPRLTVGDGGGADRPGSPSYAMQPERADRRTLPSCKI